MKFVFTIFCCLLLFFHPFSVLSQASVEWDKTLGGAEDERLYAVALAPDGGFIVGGDSRSGASGDRTEESMGGIDYWVVRTDKDGNKLWDKAYGGAGDDQLTSIIATEDGGFLLGGYSNSGMSGNKTAPSRGQSDFWVVKVDAKGNILWDKTYGGESWDRLNTMISTEDGGYFLGGETHSPASGNKTAESIGGADFWLVRIDASGNKLWDKAYGEETWGYISNITLAPNGDYLLAGHSSVKTGEIVIDGETYIQTAAAYHAIRINEDGDEIWNKLYSSGITRILRDVLVTPEGGFLLVGDENKGGQPNGYVINIDATGNVVWDRYYSGNAIDHLHSVVKTQNGYLIGGASYSDVSGDKTEPSIGDSDFWVLEIDHSGNVLWDKTIGGQQFDSMVDIAPLGEGEFLLAGFSSSDAFMHKSEDTRGENPYEQDFWLVKITTSPSNPDLQPEPTDGLLTGGGWFFSPSGALSSDPTLQGKANFSFAAKKGVKDEMPVGHFSLTFPREDFRFLSTGFNWIHVNENAALLKGEGKLNREEGYTFLLSVVDNGNGVFEPEDNLRILIWDEAENIIYDNQRGSGTYAIATTPIGKGTIKIHSLPSTSNPAARAEQKPLLENALAGFKVYPVPLAKEGIWLELPAVIEASSWHVSIFDMQGRKMAETSFPGEAGGTKKQWQPDHQGWKKGTYLMEIKSGQLKHQVKLLK